MKKWNYLVTIVALMALCLGAYTLGKGQRNSDLQGQIDDLLGQMGGLVGMTVENEKLIAEINGQLAIEAALRREAENKNVVLEKKNAGLLAENADYKKQIAAMPDAQIVVEMGRRIGDENVGNVGVPPYRFGLTRPGGERTVAIFKDAETYFTLAENRLEQINTFQFRVNSLEASLEKESEKTRIEKKDKEDAMKLLGDTKVTLEKVKKDMKLNTAKKVGTGVAIGVALAVVIHSLFGK